MIRTAKFTLKFLTKKKRELLEETFELFKFYLQKTIDLMWEGKIPVRKFMSSAKIDWMCNLSSSYKSMIYKQASEMVRSAKRNGGSKPVVKNLTIEFDERVVKVKSFPSYFDKWVKLRLPFIKEGCKRKGQELMIPLKEHKHSLKFKDWNLRKTVMINLDENWVQLVYEKETPKPKEEGKVLGIDLGYRNLITTSEPRFIGKDIIRLYEKIARKKQGSKAFKRALKERDDKINEIINKELDLSDVAVLKVEDLKNLKKGISGRFSRKFNNKYQRFVYRRVLEKLARKCEEEAVQFLRIPPEYTSQTCPVCHFRDPTNRKGERFRCRKCGYENHADVVGAMNIASREPKVPGAGKGGFPPTFDECIVVLEKLNFEWR
jgi:IS605 OrfB family transposase